MSLILVVAFGGGAGGDSPGLATFGGGSGRDSPVAATFGEGAGGEELSITECIMAAIVNTEAMMPNQSLNFLMFISRRPEWSSYRSQETSAHKLPHCRCRGLENCLAELIPLQPDSDEQVVEGVFRSR